MKKLLLTLLVSASLTPSAFAITHAEFNVLKVEKLNEYRAEKIEMREDYNAALAVATSPADKEAALAVYNAEKEEYRIQYDIDVAALRALLDE
jgi:hypothetical protein